jgi:hypothetical protein
MNPIPNFSKRTSEAKTNIKNKITKNITSETLNKLSAKVINKQKLVTENLIIDPLGLSVYKELGVQPPLELMKQVKETKCKIGQDAQIKFVAEQLGSKITQIINKDESAQKLKKELDAATSQETQGAGEAVAQGAKGIGEGVGAIFKGGTGASIVSGIVSCVCCGALLAFGMSPAGQGLANKAGSKI